MPDNSLKNTFDLFRASFRFERILEGLRPGGATREQLVAKVKDVGRPLLRYRAVLERARYRGTSILDEDTGNAFVANSIAGPAAIAKFGASELGGVVHYLHYRGRRGHCRFWGRHRTMLHRNAGVYPSDAETLSGFCQVYLEALRELDVLAVWFRPGENWVRKQFAQQAKLVRLTALEPYYHARPWSQRLAGKRVVVVSPFARTIEAQYRRREQIWPSRPETLPEFQLRTVRVPLSAALIAPEYPDWFAALEGIRREMAAQPFDVAIIGAGAWSLPLATYAKSVGACGIHLGGPTQILFGIKGRRWEKNEQIARFVNDAWVRPSEIETPKTVRQVENGCYW